MTSTAASTRNGIRAQDGLGGIGMIIDGFPAGRLNECTDAEIHQQASKPAAGNSGEVSPAETAFVAAHAHLLNIDSIGFY
jgi:hypothetical protein